MTQDTGKSPWMAIMISCSSLIVAYMYPLSNIKKTLIKGPFYFPFHRGNYLEKAALLPELLRHHQHQDHNK